MGAGDALGLRAHVSPLRVGREQGDVAKAAGQSGGPAGGKEDRTKHTAPIPPSVVDVVIINKWGPFQQENKTNLMGHHLASAVLGKCTCPRSVGGRNHGPE